MKIAGIDTNKVWVGDLETLKCYFDAGFYNPDTKEWREFAISKNRNDLYSLVKFYDKEFIDYVVGFNWIGFDMQVMMFILKNKDEWWDYDNLRICSIIYVFVQNLIDGQKYGVKVPFYESDSTVKPIDVFRIHHLDNKNRSASLKACQIVMRWKNVEEMPIPHYIKEITEDEIKEVVSYRRNDCLSTYEMLKWTMGESENPNYKGKNKIEDRYNIMLEEKLPCLNWSDVKIGEESNLKDYLEISGRKKEWVFPKSVKQFYGMKFKKFFPNTVEFQTDEVKEFVRRLGETTILGSKQVFGLKLGGLSITVAKGGLHSIDKARILKSDEKYQFTQIDVGSQYPNAYLKYGLYPEHLGPEANEMVRRKISKRLYNKSLYKSTKDPKYNSLQEMGKLSLNGGLNK